VDPRVPCGQLECCPAVEAVVDEKSTHGEPTDRAALERVLPERKSTLIAAQ
jgi:hypothetical protein